MEMFSSANKTTKTSPAVQQTTAGITFFRKAGKESFFGAKENPSFFKSSFQAKLTVSSPNDLQEKEADAVADKVMRMPEPVVRALPPEKNEEKLQCKEEEVQIKQKSPLVDKNRCKEEPGLKLHPKAATCGCGAKEDTPIHTKADTGTSVSLRNNSVSQYPSQVARQSGRDPLTGSIPFEQTIASSKGGGSALPGDTQQFMESRFNADFSGVRVHTDSTAVSLSRSINAQAFAHENDIYFNSGKFSPDSTEGRTLLAHELTHTVQQGASRSEPSSGTPAAQKQINLKKDNALFCQRSLDSSVNMKPANSEGALTAASTDSKVFKCEHYAGNAKLEACLNNLDRLKQGDKGSSVEKVQHGLTSDLEPDGIVLKADGVFGQKTGQAVMFFKKKHNLGYENFPDAGPGTMKKLDELCMGGGKGQPPMVLPACPVNTDSKANENTFAATSRPLLAIPGVTCQLQTPPPQNSTPVVDSIKLVKDSSGDPIKGFAPALCCNADENVPGPFNDTVNGQIANSHQIHFLLSSGKAENLLVTRMIKRTSTRRGIDIPKNGNDGPPADEIKRPHSKLLVVADIPGWCTGNPKTKTPACGPPFLDIDFPISYNASFILAAFDPLTHKTAAIFYQVNISKKSRSDSTATNEVIETKQKIDK